MGLERGIELIRAGAYFEAHEELEDEWRAAPEPERDFLQGLVHVAVVLESVATAQAVVASGSLELARPRV